MSGRRRARQRGECDAPSPKRRRSESLVPTRPPTPDAAIPDAPPTPSRKPKDLSQIFAPLASPSRSPDKSITKRMLVRSRTDPSPTPVPKFPVTPTPSLPIVSPIPSSPSPSRPSTRSNVRTYSNARSFLVALPASTSRDILHSNQEDDIRESYTDLRTRWGVDSSEDDPHHVPGITNELMSITELRSKGESRRFLDGVGYLFEGLENPGMSSSVKRSSAVDIVLKMCDPDFVRKAKAADFIGRAWDALRFAGAGNHDKVLDPCLAFFIALVARNRRDLDDLASKDGFFHVIISLLETPKDTDVLLFLDHPIKRKKLGFTKPEIATLANLRNIISTKADLYSSTSTPSTRLLASYSLFCLTPSPFTLPTSLLPPLLTSLLAELALLSPSQSALADSTSADLEHIEHCLCILDAFLQGGEQVSLHQEQAALSKGLIELCVVAGMINPPGERAELARRCIESTFRVLISLAHSSPELCTILLDAFPIIIPHILPPPIKEEEDEPASALDRQCLALGLLTKLVFAKDEVREKVRETKLDPSCPRDRRCARGCSCSGPTRYTALECLLRLFVDSEAESENIPDLTFFRSHLAALLCLLVVDSPPNQKIVRPYMRAVKESIKGFVDFYKGGGGARDDEGDGGKEGKEGGMVVKVQEGLKVLMGEGER